MANEGNFRKALNGFNKEDVLKYINQLAAENARLESEAAAAAQLKEENAKLTESNTALQNEVNELRSTVEQLQLAQTSDDESDSDTYEQEHTNEEYDLLSSENASLKSLVDSLTNENNNYASELAALRNSVTELTAQKEALERERDEMLTRVNKAESEVQAESATVEMDPAVIEAAENYRKLERDIGAIQLNARLAAQKIIDDANAEAMRIKQDAVEKAYSANGELAKIKNSFNENVGAFKASVSCISDELDNVVKCLDGAISSSDNV